MAGRANPGRRVAAGAVAGLLVLLAGAPLRAATSGATIAGAVVHGSTRDSVAGQEVVLHRYGNGGEVGTRTEVTDIDGEFSFAGLDAADGSSYDVTTRYQRADYRSRTILPAPGAVLRLRIEVFEATDSPKGVRLTSWIVWIDREGKGAAVQHDLEVENSGETSYVGRDAVSEGQRAVFELPLAPGASNFQYLDRFIECCAVVRGDTFVHTAAVPPGPSKATVRYSVPSLSELSFPVIFPTKSFTLLVPADVEVGSEGLTESGQTKDRGVTYRVLSATDLRPGDEPRVTISGLPGGGTSSTLLIVLVAAAVGLGAFLVVLGSILSAGRRRRRGGAKKTARRPAREKVRAHRGNGDTKRPPRPAARKAGSRGDGRRGNRDDEEEDTDASLLVEEIAALDLALERGLLDEETHRRLRAAAKGRLVRLRGRQGAGRG